MQRIWQVMILTLVFFGGAVWGSTFEVVGVEGTTLAVNGGSSDGLQKGMKGRVIRELQVAGKMEQLEIAFVRVEQTWSRSARLRVTNLGPGWTIEPGDQVVFGGSAAGSEARLTVRSNVAGDLVVIDGKEHGATPVTVTVKPGRHWVEVTKPPCTSDARSIELASGAAQTAWFELACPEPTQIPRPRRVAGKLPDFEPVPGMRFRYIPAGEFQMGSPPGESGRYDDERRHSVRLTRDYWVMETEVTQGQWRALMGSNPSHFSACGDDCPVEEVNWWEAVKYANALSRRAGLQQCYSISGDSVRFVGLQCGGYRLPTEAEWEHAARAGGSHTYSGGDDVGSVAWYGDNSGHGTHPVGQKRANALGLRDMSGNVLEWCWDRYGAYPTGPVRDPVGPSSGSGRVRRGGGWDGLAGRCRSAVRSRLDPGYRFYNLGFRLVRTASE